MWQKIVALCLVLGLLVACGVEPTAQTATIEPLTAVSTVPSTVDPTVLFLATGRSRLQESLEVWHTQRDAHGGSYQYEVSFQSWTGSRSTTTLIVQDNVVVERHFESSWLSDNGETVLYEESWQETVHTELGTHTGADPVKTIDELYAECADSVLTLPASENEFVLEFRPDGILDTCVYIPHNCADDCAMGVGIDKITFTDESSP